MSDDLRAQLSLSLGSTYILDRELEGSGASRVFVAKELLTDRDVVVKVLSTTVTEGVSAERFAREVHLAGALQEPHTVPILSTGRTSTGQLYYTMPLIRGQTLRERLAEAPVGFDEAVVALRDVARAMDHAHRQGIVHRDIEPGKVFLLKNTAVITDFGIAKALEVARFDSGGPRLKLVGTTHGAPAYMAPEHATSDPSADHRADIYAWGVMAYEVLSDGHPFADLTSEEELRAAHISEPVPVMLHKRYGVPEHLALLVMRCLAKDPADRPASAAELLVVLERIPLGASTLVLESKTAARWIGASIGLALVLFVALATALWQLQSSDPAEPPLVAVLPFESNGAISDSLFSVGLEMTLRQRLGQLSSVRIIDRASTRSLPSAARYAVESGRALNAEFVLATSLRWFHDVDGTALVQVSPSLLHLPDGKVKWTGSPAIVSPAEPFAAQAVLATQVAQAIGLELGPDDKSMLATSGTNDTAAYRAYMRGMRLLRENTSASSAVFTAALEHFRRAVAVDSRYADAFAGIAMSFAQLARTSREPAFLDSATRPTRLALAILPTQLQALTVSSALSLARNRPEDAIGKLERERASILSDPTAMAMHMSLSLLFRDSAAAWLDAERLLSIAPRTPDALLAAAITAQALRRNDEARDLLVRARKLAPARGDIVLRLAHLDRAEGKFTGMAQSLRAYRAMGAPLTVDALTLLRVGSQPMQDELANGDAAAFNATSRADSIVYFNEKAKLFLARKDQLRARALLDSTAVLLRVQIGDSTVSEWDRQRAEELLGWTDAARGDAYRALASVADVERPPSTQRWRSGKLAAMEACNGAEVFGLLGQFTQMLTQLRRCLTLPGGYSASDVATEPAFARYATDPRVHALLAELGLEDSRIQ